MNRNPGQVNRGANLNPAMYNRQYPSYQIVQPRSSMPYGSIPGSHPRPSQPGVIQPPSQSQPSSTPSGQQYLRSQAANAYQYSTQSNLQAQTAAPLQTSLNAPTHSTATTGSSTAVTTPSGPNGHSGPIGVPSGQLALSNETQLDPNDFPALGPSSATISGNTTNNAIGQSYASQAQQNSAVANGAAGAATRDFTNPDDFPALGGQGISSIHGTPPPGLNGYSNAQQPTHPGTIGHRTMVQSEQDRRQPLKGNAQGANQIWTSQPQTYANGIHSQAQATLGSTGGFQTSYHQSQQQQRAPSANGQSPDQNLGNTTNHGQSHTPADQVLHSAADRWGLLGLLRMLRNQSDDAALLQSGQDLGTLGLELDNPGSLYRTFATPWQDFPSNAPSAEPNYHLPASYNVTPPSPNPAKATQWTEDTLFFVFYATPRDVFQDIAAQELYNRNWRFHKELKIWLTPQESQVGEGPTQYWVWDLETWQRLPKTLSLNFHSLENRDPVVERTVPQSTQQEPRPTIQHKTSQAAIANQPHQQLPSQFAPMHMRV